MLGGSLAAVVLPGQNVNHENRDGAEQGENDQGVHYGRSSIVSRIREMRRRHGRYGWPRGDFNDSIGFDLRKSAR